MSNLPAGIIAESLPVVVRSTVPVKNNYQDYREHLRFDFFFACSYCSMSETEAQGIGFQIDHFMPTNSGGTNDYLNLMWTCQLCNRAKSAIWPDATKQAAGYRYLRPDQENPSDHYDLQGFRLNPITIPGEFTVEVLFLNRPNFRKLRESRSRLLAATRSIIGGLQQIQRVRIDTLKPEVRAKFLEARESTLEQVRRLRECDESGLVVRVLNHSPILDPNPSVREANKRRRDYLASLGSVTDLSFEPGDETV